jgi:hypothetical protein
MTILLVFLQTLLSLHKRCQTMKSLTMKKMRLMFKTTS